MALSVKAIQDFFAAPENQGKIATQLRKSEFALEEVEATPVSAHSPGPVQSNETLARLLFSPYLFDPDTGKPTTLALKDAEHRGLSVDRVEMGGVGAVHERGRAKAQADTERKARKVTYEGFSPVDCGVVRALRDGKGARQFFVFDTAMESNRAHADICHGRFANDMEKAVARVALMEAFRPLVPPAAW